MTVPDDDAQRQLAALLDVVLPRARHDLERTGSTVPFGAAVEPDGLITLLVDRDPDEPQPAAEALSEVFRRARESAAELSSVAVVAHARHEGEPVLRVHFETAEGVALALFVPYSRLGPGGVVHLGRLHGGRTDPVIWPD